MKSFLCLFLVFQTVLCCPDGWSYLPATDSCYRYFNEQRTWNQATDRCVAEGGELASVGGVVENGFIQAVAAKGIDLGWGGMPWIGGFSDNPATNSWKWQNSGKWAYTNWCPQVPNYPYDREERCVHMVTDQCKTCTDHFRLGCWNNMHCDNQLPFVCKRRTSAAPPKPARKASSGDLVVQKMNFYIRTGNREELFSTGTLEHCLSAVLRNKHQKNAFFEIFPDSQGCVMFKRISRVSKTNPHNYSSEEDEVGTLYYLKTDGTAYEETLKAMCKSCILD